MASGTNFHLVLLSNSAVVAWGADDFGQTNIPSGLSNVVAIAAGGAHALALKEDGSVVAWGGLTNVPPGLSNVMNVAAGTSHSLALKNDGTVVAWGDNAYGQTGVWLWVSQAKMIAGGGDFSLAIQFSSLVMYTVDVTKDLLLIYNTSSSNSPVVKDYYLAHRPMVSGANVLGISCETNEIIDITNLSAEILDQYSQWLDDNPTKRPQYVVLFPDIPTRVWRMVVPPIVVPYTSSVAYFLVTSRAGPQPFATSINMGFRDATNDCIAYIKKLERFGTNHTLLISASAGGYRNTNYLRDEVAKPCGSGSGARGTFPELEAAGVPSASITVQYGSEGPCAGSNCSTCVLGPHITNSVDVAAYFCWGAHSALENEYPRDPRLVSWSGNSSWWIIETEESFKGQRSTGQGNFTQWFSDIAFGGTNYECTPVGAVSHTDEPGKGYQNDLSVYLPLWAQGKSFAICAWNSRRTDRFQAVGDPFVRR
jgi:hypothetical protein